MKIIKINVDNVIENIDIKINDNNIKTELEKNTTNKGNNNIIELYNWNNKKIKAYGWISGTLNKNIHKLPPCGESSNIIEPSEELTLYGTIFILRFDKNKVINYDISEYGELYYILTSDDLDKEYENSDSEEDNIINNIVVENNEEISIIQNNLLDEDLTDYK